MSSAMLKAAATGAYRANDDFQELLARPLATRFDPDAYHVMQERDNALIRDEIMHGAASKAFVYSFQIKGSTVTGISVVGARELASQYKGIKSRIVATVEKRGALFIFRSFNPLNIETRVLHELEEDEDFYECVMEVSDIKTGNSIEVRKKESKFEKKRDGGLFERPHFDVIAESKAYRNGVLSVLPQSVIKDFQAKCLASGNASNEQTIDQRRAQVLAFAAKHAVALSRQALGDLSYAELDGLGGAARESIEAFRASARALNILAASEIANQQTGEVPAPPAPRPPAAAPRAPATDRPAANAAQSDQQQGQPPADPEPDVNAIAEQMEKATSLDALDLVADSMRDVKDADAAQTLGDIYHRRRQELTEKAAATPAAGAAPARRTRSAGPAPE